MIGTRERTPNSPAPVALGTLPTRSALPTHEEFPTMRVLILRHGKAEKDSVSGRDEDRALANRGHDQIGFLARRMLHADHEPFGVRLERIVSSRAKRADQTASIVSEIIGLPIEYVRELSLGQPLTEFLDLLRALARQNISCVLAVGHNPQLEAAAAHLGALAARQGHAFGLNGGLRTGELVAFEVEFGAAGRDWDNDDMKVTPIGRSRFDDGDGGGD